MNSEETKQLELLALFHYIVGGITALFSCMPFIHVFMGLFFVFGNFEETTESSSQAPEAWLGWIFVIMGSLFILTGWAVAACIIAAGRKLKARKNRMFCMVIAGIECMFMPFGTVLGIFTLITLNKETVRAAFDGLPNMPPVPDSAT